MTIPQIGFGTWPMKGEECYSAVRCSLESGYTHIDTAQMYGNEVEVGRAIKDSGIPREQLHVTTKIWPDKHGKDKFEKAVAQSLRDLDMEYVDLLLLHWPSKTVALEETIPLLNKLMISGKANAIGISNFTTKQIAQAVQLSENALAVNQIEYHPFLDQEKVMTECKKHGLGIIAYCPLARGRDFDQGVIREIAGEYNRTPTQIVLRWHIQQGIIVIPKSATPSRIRENISITDFELTSDAMDKLSNLKEKDGRICDFEFSPEWD